MARRPALLGALLALAITTAAHAQLPAAPVDCFGPAGDPAPGTQAWQQRDAANMYCAGERMVDEYSSPAFGATFWPEGAAMYARQNVLMLTDPAHPHITLEQLVPGGSETDPFRTLRRWKAAGRGRVSKISFPAADGATLNGHIFRPPASVKGPYPGVVITTGSIQGYQQMYFWAAEGLAEAGYMVMTYDVQGQGNSDTLPAQQNCTGPQSCQGVPFQQSYNFYQGTEDALNYFFSSAKHPYTSPSAPATTGVYNRFSRQLDRDHVGLAGHSLGASAVSFVGQCDPRVSAIVAWDNLAPDSGTCAAQIPTGLPNDAPAKPTMTVPALGINSEYFLNQEPMQSPPDPQSKSAGYQQLVKAGTDAMQVALRSSTHLEYTYVPYILPASRLGERVAFFYTLAWLDRYVKGDAAATDRLTATTFDGSSDAHSIGAGTYDAAKAAARPTDTTAGNVPYTIKGAKVADRLSFYYESAYSLTRRKQHVTCTDMRAGCPATAPQYP